LKSTSFQPGEHIPEAAGRPGNRTMKLVIQIPCFNEAETLPEVFRDLPRSVAGFEQVEILVIDDGSTDGTDAVARQLGADHVLRLPTNRGLATAFARGLQASLGMEADVIVNTDGDHQYRGGDIPSLVQPILNGSADMVVGDRRVETIPHFSILKKALQKLGSWVVRWASRTGVPDATSGFRALSREAAMHLVVFSSYTYTLETIIQAGRQGLAVAWVPVTTNPVKRSSRLIQSLPLYIARSAMTILRIFLMYEALPVFLLLGSAPFLAGLLLVGRFAYFYLQGDGAGHIQSLIIATLLIVLAVQTFLLGFLADLVAKNRHLAEEINYQLKKRDAGP
jgi:glycosyltransferase involved in cell wall biosynthesis